MGAGRVEDARTGARAATWMAITPLAMAGLVYAIAPEALLGLFTSDREIVSIGAPALIVGAFEGIFLGAFQTISGGIRGAGDTRTPMLVTITGVWLVRLPMCALLGLPPELTWGLGLGLGLTGIWLGTLLDWSFRCTLIMLAFNAGRWKKMKV